MAEKKGRGVENLFCLIWRKIEWKESEVRDAFFLSPQISMP